MGNNDVEAEHEEEEREAEKVQQVLVTNYTFIYSWLIAISSNQHFGHLCYTLNLFDFPVQFENIIIL